jgi:hypothetical protein
MPAHRKRPEWGSVQAWNEAMKDIFARCINKMTVQVRTVIIIYLYLVMSCNLVICCNFLRSGSLISFFYNVFTKSTGKIHCRYEAPREEPREAHGY